MLSTGESYQSSRFRHTQVIHLWNISYVNSDDGSNFGNFYNGALQDFEAKQASRIEFAFWTSSK